jgi:putative addiction module component (TIGR02574 family)
MDAEEDCMPKIETLLVAAARLSVPDPLRLIEAIWDSMPKSALPPLSDEWLAKVDRRSIGRRRGWAATVPWREVRADALRRLPSSSD